MCDDSRWTYFVHFLCSASIATARASLAASVWCEGAKVSEQVASQKCEVVKVELMIITILISEIRNVLVGKFGGKQQFLGGNFPPAPPLVRTLNHLTHYL